MKLSNIPELKMVLTPVVYQMIKEKYRLEIKEEKLRIKNVLIEAVLINYDNCQMVMLERSATKIVKDLLDLFYIKVLKEKKRIISLGLDVRYCLKGFCTTIPNIHTFYLDYFFQKLVYPNRRILYNRVKKTR